MKIVKMRAVLILVIIGAVSCSRHGRPVILESNLSYDQLPEIVQQAIHQYNRYSHYEVGDNRVLNLDTAVHYEFSVAETGPWTDYYLLIDKSANKKYQIPQGEAFPFIIYNKSLYIPGSYNLANSDEALTAGYKKFSLTK